MIATPAAAGGAARTVEAVARGCPEKAFITWRIIDALNEGDVAWLEKCALFWLEFIVGDDVDPVAKHAELVEMARQVQPPTPSFFAVQLGFPWNLAS